MPGSIAPAAIAAADMIVASRKIGRPSANRGTPRQPVYFSTHTPLETKDNLAPI